MDDALQDICSVHLTIQTVGTLQPIRNSIYLPELIPAAVQVLNEVRLIRSIQSCSCQLQTKVNLQVHLPLLLLNYLILLLS